MEHQVSPTRKPQQASTPSKRSAETRGNAGPSDVFSDQRMQLAFEDRRSSALTLAGLQRKADQHASLHPVPFGLSNATTQRKPSVATLQFKKRFDSSAEAEAYVLENPPDRKVDTTAPKYFNRLKKLLGKTADREDLGWLEPAATTAWKGTSGSERKTLSSSEWQHIWRGDLGSKGHPTGFHWKGKADDAIAEGDGTVTATSGDFYHEGVNLKAGAVEDGTIKRSSVKRWDKPDGSTFFPDDWSEQTVKDAIELRNSSDQITVPEDAAGTQLTKSGDTIYPSIS